MLGSQLGLTEVIVLGVVGTGMHIGRHVDSPRCHQAPERGLHDSFGSVDLSGKLTKREGVRCLVERLEETIVKCRIGIVHKFALAA